MQSRKKAPTRRHQPCSGAMASKGMAANQQRFAPRSKPVKFAPGNRLLLPAEPPGILATGLHYSVFLSMPGPGTIAPALFPTPAEKMLTAWLRERPGVPAVKRLAPTTQERLLEVLQQILSHPEEVNVDREDVWKVLAGSGSLQFGTATACGSVRVGVVSRQVWTTATLGNAESPVKRVLAAIHSSLPLVLNTGEPAQILALSTERVGNQAEIVFGHGHDAQLGESIRVMLLISRHETPSAGAFRSARPRQWSVLYRYVGSFGSG